MENEKPAKYFHFSEMKFVSELLLHGILFEFSILFAEHEIIKVEGCFHFFVGRPFRQ